MVARTPDFSEATSAPSARDRLLTAALDHFASEGALVATLDRVREDAGVSTGALYHHFADKRALATALYTDLLSAYQSGVLELLREEPDARRGVEGVVRHHLRWSARHRRETLFLLSQRETVDGDEVAAQSRPFMGEVLSWYRGHAHYGAVRDAPFDVIHALWLGPSQEYLRHWLAGRARTVPRQVVGALAAAAWNSLKEAP